LDEWRHERNPAQARHQRAERVLNGRVRFHGIALWMPDASLVPVINQVVDQGTEVVVFLRGCWRLSVHRS